MEHYHRYLPLKPHQPYLRYVLSRYHRLAKYEGLMQKQLLKDLNQDIEAALEQGEGVQMTCISNTISIGLVHFQVKIKP